MSPTSPTHHRYGLFSAVLILLVLLTACAAPQTAAPAPTDAAPATRAPETATAPAQPSATTAALPLATAAATAEALPSETQTAEPAFTPLPEGVVLYKIVPGESKITYQVGEVFIDQGNVFNQAIGVTTQISGDVLVNTLDPRLSSIGPISVDISQFQSDSGRRDQAIRDRWLESGKYPIAVFTPTEIFGLPAGGTPGTVYSLVVKGDLTVRETTQQMEFVVSVKLENEVLSGKGTASLLLSDFGIGPIEIAGMLKTEDVVQLTFEFVARP